MNHQIKLFGKALPESEYGTPYFWFDSLSGSDKINELFEYQLVVKVRDEFHNPAHGYAGLEGYVPKQLAQNGGSPASDLNLQSLIGTEIAVAVRLDGLKPDFSGLGNINDISGDSTYQSNLNGTRYFRGLVNRVEALAVRNRHAMYKLTLVPWVWLLTKTSNYRIFQHKTVLQIIEEVLQPYPYPVDYRCSQSYAALDFQAQYGEDDYSFIHRLMQEHGINFHFEHSQNQLTFVISDHNAAYKEMEATGYRNLSIYPPNQRFPDTAEYIEHFEPVQQLVSGKVQLSDYQFKQPSLVQSAQDQFLWDHDYAEQEIYEWQQGDFLSADEGGQNKAKSRVEGLYQHGYRAEGQGKLKGLQTGYRFNLDNHPNSESNRGWLVLGTQITIQDISQEKTDNQFYDSNVRFLAQPDEQILRPDLTRNKPQGHPQTATVVGPAGEEIYTDQYGRVKVKFHWDRLGAQAQDEGADTGDGTNTCWLRVSTAWAGNHFGTIHLPRIGQEVIVDFFNGDPDMPFVSGRLNNPEQMPVWELPSQKALSGIKSKELGGSQANQLVMDDSKGQVQVHLRSDHQASELNLGYITRIPDPKGRKDFRGEGFELRTDGHGVFRAGQGLILSTYAKANAESYAKDIQNTLEQIKEGVEQQKTQTQIAIDQKADERAIDNTAYKELESQSEEIKGQGTAGKNNFPELSAPHVVVGTPAGVAVLAEKSIHLKSNEQIALTSGKDVSLATGERLFASASQGISLFTQSKGARLFAATDKVEIQAQEGAMDLLSKQGLTITSTEDEIKILAKKKITINAGSSQIEISADGIISTTSGKFESKASTHSLISGANVPAHFPAPPKQGKGLLDIFYVFDHGFGMKDAKYLVTDALGKKHEGKLDQNGFVSVSNLPPGPAKVLLKNDAVNPFDESNGFSHPYPEIPLESLGEQVISKVPEALLNQVDKLKDIKNVYDKLQTAKSVIDKFSLK
ncbi:type VI secretion system tip protein TssI/VgrG [Acinetobacter gerneri]|uniref:Type VI secretion system tip protein TssI/VgrG n=1 Tax=Acinetobacter gerneri TaxID=202952 RepID=A0AAW8JNZ0_9GAMM|nr:type VI secretion system tip protein TssI/VgrG [Acinetobacter gerneri]MDQ9011498.1 type VI secretion system tip protein TssI/VgrG [Acinetobacter gerneri]MDQ9015623.1 type VI secretion system tip protein TssI/VgrG [Acinetobacter gerneri]MDQ9026794.1 type VI secretion system tip protein TssI/VgrG [Acinetobacter gerneri]MDQ9054086.1 type VI secretion system tip protein TssI/VgrG [Acinetobacter gerneri]MDQ9061745.1 type VI secretion system tip protein TssI/VgrG [Acinetobacter gerneri]